MCAVRIEIRIVECIARSDDIRHSNSHVSVKTLTARWTSNELAENFGTRAVRSLIKDHRDDSCRSLREAKSKLMHRDRKTLQKRNKRLLSYMYHTTCIISEAIDQS